MIFSSSKLLGVIGAVVLCLVVFAFLPVGKRIFAYLFQVPKDASVVVANDNDQTMANVYYEFKEFNIQGYSQGRYPELEELYCSRENWHAKNIANFSTTVRMRSFGIEKEIYERKWENLVSYLDECISGYRQFVPFRQETAAITYLQPFMNTISRIANQGNDIPPTIKSQVIMKLEEFAEMVQHAPNESENRFKIKFLSCMEKNISKLK